MEERCGALGDFGHTNLFGTPILKFMCTCLLPKGHKGKHQSSEKLGITSTFEKHGITVDRNSIEVSPKEILVKWNSKP